MQITRGRKFKIWCKKFGTKYKRDYITYTKL